MSSITTGEGSNSGSRNTIGGANSGNGKGQKKSQGVHNKAANKKRRDNREHAAAELARKNGESEMRGETDREGPRDDEATKRESMKRKGKPQKPRAKGKLKPGSIRKREPREG